MWTPDRGFRIYPQQEFIREWGYMATEHLLKVDLVSEGIDQGEGAWIVKEIRDLAEAASRYYKIAWPPKEINSCLDAYLRIRHGTGVRQAMRYLRESIRPPAGGPARVLAIRQSDGVSWDVEAWGASGSSHSIESSQQDF